MTDTYVSKRAQKAERQRASEQRRIRVAKALLAGTPQRQIAADEGVALGTITDDVMVIKAAWKRRYAATYDAHVSEEIAKCDALEQAIMARALDGKVTAIDRLIKIMERRARLLGLDAPVRHRVEVITEDATDAEIKRLENELAGNDGAAVT